VYSVHSLLLRLHEGCEVLQSACLKVFLFTCISQKLHVQTAQDFLYVLSLAVAWSCDDSMTIQYIMYFQFCAWCHARQTKHNHCSGVAPLQLFTSIFRTTFNHTQSVML